MKKLFFIFISFFFIFSPNVFAFDSSFVGDYEFNELKFNATLFYCGSIKNDTGKCVFRNAPNFFDNIDDKVFVNYGKKLGINYPYSSLLSINSVFSLNNKYFEKGKTYTLKIPFTFSRKDNSRNLDLSKLKLLNVGYKIDSNDVTGSELGNHYVGEFTTSSSPDTFNLILVFSPQVNFQKLYFSIMLDNPSCMINKECLDHNVDFYSEIKMNIPDSITTRDGDTVTPISEEISQAELEYEEYLKNLKNKNKFFNFFSSFNTSDYGLRGVISAPLKLLNGFMGGSCENLSFKFKNKDISFPSGCEFWSRIPNKYVNIYYVLLLAPISYYFLIDIFRTIEKMKNPDINDRIEVIDL